MRLIQRGNLKNARKIYTLVFLLKCTNVYNRKMWR